ncbi:uncharacterized protein [Haliotis cracherodii]|uniref:uncharacterized protein n=1 Tax=Haliotis cracherodii TaxID=6455 RepID=UPI0039EC3068
MAGSGVSPLEGARNRYISELISQTQDALVDVPLQLRRQILDKIDKTLETGLHNVEERISSYHQDFCKPDLDQEGLMQIFHQLIHMENLLMQIFRNKRTEIEIDQSENEGTDIEDADHIHLELFKLCHLDLLNDVSIEGTYILDRLIQDQLLTDDERESIIAINPTPRRRKDAFLDLMRGRLSYSTLMNNFIPAVGEDYPDVAKKLSETAQHLKSISPRTHVCAVCNMRENVQVKNLAQHLLKDGVISAGDYQELRNTQTSNTTKWSYLFAKITNMNHVAEAIKTSYPQIYKQLQHQNKLDLRCNCSSLEEDNDSCSTDKESTGIARSDVGRLSDLESLFETSVSFSSGTLSQTEYQVHSTPKGIAVIICNPNSNPHAELHRYFEKDAAKLYRTFQKLDFDTRLYTNISQKYMKALLDSVAHMDHSQYDAFVCVIHTETKIIGYRQCVLDAKAAPVPFEDLKDMFNASRCPTLSGKPKVFLIPCGQGNNSMLGVKPGSRTGNDTTVPSESDFLVLQATAPGFNVIGDDEFSGTLWVKKFTELMDRHSNNIDVVTCMTHLTAEISCQNLWGFYKQSPHIESTLRKPLFFRETTPDDISTG